MSELELPKSLEINAWTGDPEDSTSELSPQALSWGTGKPPQRKNLLAASQADPRDVMHPDIGWGLVLNDDDALGAAERAEPAGAPNAIRRLWESRPGSPVFRYRPDGEFGFLRRYYADGSHRDLSLVGSRGLGLRKVPFYLLLVGPPSEIPWELQFFLNGPCHVGRLDLEEPGLSRYVDALIDGWSSTETRMDHPVAWAVDHGHPDITWLMRKAFVDPLVAKLRTDSQIEGRLVYLPESGRATAAGLIDSLEATRPALVVTSSHGMTGPLDDKALMAQQLGLPVDEDHALLRPEDLLSRWQPDGALWVAQACCSAGGAGKNRFKGLLKDGSRVDTLLDAVAALGPLTAPLPKALLGAEKPLRAFVGQIDPTFDWTLLTRTGQVVTESMIHALSPSLHLVDPTTVALGFERYFNEVGTLFRMWDRHRRDAGALEPGARTAAVDARLTAQDRESLVILGDPTVVPTRLPPDVGAAGTPD